jgi:hypothetical protein
MDSKMRARYIAVNKEDVLPFDTNTITYFTGKEFLEKVKNKELFKDLKFGDCLHFDHYRNNDKFYWDNRWIPVEHHDIPYSIIPLRFSMFIHKELPLDYYTDTIYYNAGYFGWNPRDFQDQLIENFTIEKDTIESKESIDCAKTFFTFQNCKFKFSSIPHDCFTTNELCSNIFPELTYVMGFYEIYLKGKITTMKSGSEIPEFLKKHIVSYCPFRPYDQYAKHVYFDSYQKSLIPFDQSLKCLPGQFFDTCFVKLDENFETIISRAILSNETLKKYLRLGFVERLLLSKIIMIGEGNYFFPDEAKEWDCTALD